MKSEEILDISTVCVVIWFLKITSGSYSLKISESKNCQFQFFEKILKSENRTFWLFQKYQRIDG